MDAALAAALQDAPGALFLCSGNMIRSAFADLWARHLGCPRPVASAATRYRNDRLHPAAARALLARGVGPEVVHGFRPRTLAELRPPPGSRWVVFGMEREHLAAARGLRGTRPFLLRAALGRPGEIADPYFGGGIEETLDEVALCVGAVVDAWTARGAPTA